MKIFVAALVMFELCLASPIDLNFKSYIRGAAESLIDLDNEVPNLPEDVKYGDLLDALKNGTDQFALDVPDLFDQLREEMVNYKENLTEALEELTDAVTSLETELASQSTEGKTEALAQSLAKAINKVEEEEIKFKEFKDKQDEETKQLLQQVKLEVFKAAQAIQANIATIVEKTREGLSTPTSLDPVDHTEDPLTISTEEFIL